MGRQTLIEPIVWTKDGWFKSAITNNISTKINLIPNTRLVDDDFSDTKLNLQWIFSDAETSNNARLEDHRLVIINHDGHEGALLAPMSES